MRLTLLTLLLPLCACATTGASRGANMLAPGASEAGLEQLKGLAGSWKMHAEGEDAKDAHYSVTAGGSTVIETIFAGTPHEMVTTFHLDGGELALTHYCVLGNQPGMRALPTADGSLHFLCTGEGIADELEAHMHEARFEFAADGSVSTVWTLHEGGEPVEEARFHLVRP